MEQRTLQVAVSVLQLPYRNQSLSDLSTRSMTLRKVFMNISPFRRTLMGMLRPYDVAKLAAALGCDLTEAERKKYMNTVDDMFPDRSELIKLQDLGCRVSIFGADLRKLELRLSSPLHYEHQFGRCQLQIFVLVSCPAHSLGSTIQPRWIQINSSYSDIRVSAYDNTMIGLITPWIAMRSDLMESALGVRSPTGLLHSMQQQLLPCIRLEAGEQSCILLYSQLKPRAWMESNLLDNNPRVSYSSNSFIVAPCWSHSYVMLQVDWCEVRQCD